MSGLMYNVDLNLDDASDLYNRNRRVGYHDYLGVRTLRTITYTSIVDNNATTG